MARILLVDDDSNLREVVAYILGEAGHEVIAAGGGREGLQLFETERPDLVLTDVRMPDLDGMEVLRQIRAALAESLDSSANDVPVIVLTAHGTVEQAVEAMSLGAFTYLLKPFNRDELKLTVDQALRSGALAADNRNLRRLLSQKNQQPALIYHSSAMTRLMEQVRQAAASEIGILLTGESGTGKELVARACHDLSPRWDRPFVPVNCGALPAQLMEAELFGHARGAFTGAERAATGRIRGAAHGTLLLDEIAELPLELQPKLLRVLDTKQVDPVGGPAAVEVDFRLVCATNRNLEQAVAEGSFREDLFYRIAILHLHLPPLRDRREDIAPLWEHFTRLHGGPELSSEAALLAELEGLPWRGNVRELRNLNQRLVLMRQGDTLTTADLAAVASNVLTRGKAPAGIGELGRGIGGRGGSTTADPGVPRGAFTSGEERDQYGTARAGGLAIGPLPEEGCSLPELEKEIIRRALVRCDGNKTRTARYLGIPRHVLVYRLTKYSLR